jgi:Predicted phosphohydrolases
MNYIKFKNYHFCYSVAFILLIRLFYSPFGLAQANGNDQRIYFISDVQAPMPIETIILKAYRNEEARDSLFADVIMQHPKNLFMLGDLTSMGSNEKAWIPVDSLLHSLSKINTSVYAIPGNHDYLMKSSIGMQMFKHRFPEQWLYGYCVNIDSLAIIMLNSNFYYLTKNELSEQLSRYKTVMDSLDVDPKIKAIIVCTHHAPYSNSRIVGSSKPVADLFVPRFENTKKAKLFISGHSHNLEYFADSIGKHFLVIGGGGGLTQPLVPMNKRIHNDLIKQDEKPLYFYLVIEKNGNCLKLIARGFKRDFKMFEINFGEIKLN